MIVETIHNNPALFSESGIPFLMAKEVENVLIIGISTNLVESAGHSFYSYDETYFWIVRDVSSITGVAMLTPPHDLVLSCPFTDPSLIALAESLLELNISLPGVLGPDYAAEKFADIWGESTSKTADLFRKERGYRLDTINPLKLASGNMIQAEYNQKSFLESWVDGFNKNTNGEINTSQLDTYISDGRLFIWFDDEPKSMAVWTGPTPNGVRVTMVYTPPESRRRGYATSLVSSLSSMLLQQGKTFCSLYTDLANPISNSIYQQIGYKPVIDLYHYRFV
ncbi:GNAT family N-acetyltransferase [Chloroflexota bacterium]